MAFGQSSAARYFPGLLPRRNGSQIQTAVPIEGFAGTTETPETDVPAGEEISDETLILYLQEKNVEALGLLYRRYARLVYSICSRILKDSAEAEDLVHEVFLGLYRRCKSFDPNKGCARSWLLTLTYHKCFDWRDYLRARHGHESGNGDSIERAARLEQFDGRDPADQIIWNPRMKAAFGALSKEQQLVLNLYYFEGYTFQEISHRLGHSYGNVKHHVYRGIEHLRRIVFDEVTRSPMKVSHGVACESKEAVR